MAEYIYGMAIKGAKIEKFTEKGNRKPSLLCYDYI